jgi:hypothetical protein
LTPPPIHVAGSLVRADPAGWLRHETAGVPFAVLIGG